MKLSIPLHPHLMVMLILLFAVPRADIDGLPIPVGGIDVLIPLALGAAILWFFHRTTIPIPRYWPILVYVFASFWMLLSMLGAFLFYWDVFDQAEFQRVLLQSLRRLPGLFIFLLILAYPPSPQRITHYLSVVSMAILASGFFFYVIALGFLPGVDVATPLMGNLVFQIAGSITGGYSEVFSVRGAGNTGSPTSYGILCSIVLFLYLDWWRSKRISSNQALWVICLAGLLLFSTSAKAVIAFTYVVFFIYALVYWFRPAVFVGLLPLMVMAALWPKIDQLWLQYKWRAANSGEGRFSYWAQGLEKMQESPSFALFGHGWRALESGWHSEPFEILFSVGLAGAVILIVSVYVALPLFMRSYIKSNNDLITKGFITAVFAVIILSSAFQDLLFDVYVHFVLCMLLGFIITLSYKNERI